MGSGGGGSGDDDGRLEVAVGSGMEGTKREPVPC